MTIRTTSLSSNNSNKYQKLYKSYAQSKAFDAENSLNKPFCTQSAMKKEFST